MKSSLNQQFFDELAIELRDYVLPAESELIRQELELHIDERRAQLLEMGLTEIEAEAAAIAALGPPSEIAKPYASVKSPGRKFNLLAALSGLLACVFVYGYLAGVLNQLALLGLGLALTASSVWLGVQGAKKGYALTFGRLINFTGWVTILGLLSLLIQHLPNESKVAVTISVSEPIVETRIYKAPDNRFLLSLSDGPIKGTAYLVFTREPASKDTPPLPSAYITPYLKESKFAYAAVDRAIQTEFRQNTKQAIVVALLGGLVCGAACATAALIGRRPRRNQPSKNPPLRPSQTS